MKKTNRIKQTLKMLATRDDAEAAMNELALAVNNQRRLVARRDGEVLEINKKYESALGQLDEDIREKTDSLRAWAEANPSQFPKDRKSMALVAGILGFRTGTPKLALLSRVWSWDRVLERLCTVAKDWVRTKVEVDKEAILTAHSQAKTTDADLAAVGVKVVQDETFYVEPNLTVLEARQTQEAA